MRHNRSPTKRAMPLISAVTKLILVILLAVLVFSVANEVRGTLVGEVKVRLENDTPQALSDVRVVLRGDSADIGTIGVGGSSTAALRPKTEGPVIIRSSSLKKDSLSIPLYVSPSHLPGKGRLTIQILADTFVIRRKQNEWFASKDRSRGQAAP